MTRVFSSTGDDPQQLMVQLREALHGGPAIALGGLDGAPAQATDGTAVVLATSGSSGIPKQVVLSAEALYASAEATAERLGHGRWVLALPAGYVAGLQVLVRSLLADTEPVFAPAKFTPQGFAEASLRALGAEPLLTSLVPAQLSSLIDASDDAVVLSALRSYRAILIGGQAMSDELRQRVADLDLPVVRTYGSTETSGGCIYDGIPLQTVAVREVHGELQIAGPMLADSYAGDEALTERTFLRDGHGIRWYRTGDLGIVEDGIVRVHGRADNVIVSGGINVSLDRVQKVVRQVPGLSDAVLAPVADKKWGEASVIVASRGDEFRRSKVGQLEHARQLVADEIGAHARPARLILIDSLPTLASGKVDRTAVRRIVAELDE